jgi:hypothetical protein
MLHRLFTPNHVTKMSCPYDAIDPEQLQRDADDCLLTYGTAFYPEIITATDGIYFETASGHRMMDVRYRLTTLHSVPQVVFTDPLHSLRAARCPP